MNHAGVRRHMQASFGLYWAGSQAGSQPASQPDRQASGVLAQASGDLPQASVTLLDC